MRKVFLTENQFKNVVKEIACEAVNEELGISSEIDSEAKRIANMLFLNRFHGIEKETNGYKQYTGSFVTEVFGEITIVVSYVFFLFPNNEEYLKHKNDLSLSGGGFSKEKKVLNIRFMQIEQFVNVDDLEGVIQHELTHVFWLLKNTKAKENKYEIYSTASKILESPLDMSLTKKGFEWMTSLIVYCNYREEVHSFTQGSFSFPLWNLKNLYDLVLSQVKNGVKPMIAINEAIRVYFQQTSSYKILKKFRESYDIMVNYQEEMQSVLNSFPEKFQQFYGKKFTSNVPTSSWLIKNAGKSLHNFEVRIGKAMRYVYDRMIKMDEVQKLLKQ